MNGDPLHPEENARRGKQVPRPRFANMDDHHGPIALDIQHPRAELVSSEGQATNAWPSVFFEVFRNRN